MSASAIPARRSRAVSAAYTAMALLLFFGIGLAGGAAYKFYLAADRDAAADAAPSPAPAQAAAANRPTSPPAKDATDLARIGDAAPTPPAISPPSAFFAGDAPAPPAPLPSVEPTSPPAETVATAATRAAPVAPPKPGRPAAKAAHPAPGQVAARHTSPKAPGNLAGPYRVQFGAFADENNAQRVRWAIEASGVSVEVSEAHGASGHPLYFLRSPPYADYAAALGAARTVQERVQHFVNAIPIEYVIFGDHSAREQEAEAR